MFMFVDRPFPFTELSAPSFSNTETGDPGSANSVSFCNGLMDGAFLLIVGCVLMGAGVERIKMTVGRVVTA